MYETKKQREDEKRRKVAACHYFLFICFFWHYLLDFNSHIPSATCTEYTHHTSKVVYLFFIFFSAQNEVSPQQRGKCIKIEYLHKYKLFVAYFVAFSRAGGRGSWVRESPLETVATVRFLLSSFRLGCNYLSCQEESRCHLSWPRIFLAQLEIKLTATATSGRECGMWSPKRHVSDGPSKALWHD